LKLPGKQKRTEARIARDIAIFESHMRGNSVRAICDDFGIKSTQTIWGGIQRGREIVKERGIDIEDRRIDIDRMFKNTLGLLVKTAEQQAFEGQIETIHGPGGTIVKTKKGIDPRIAGELSRSLNRWAEFCGLLERAPEISTAQTLISLAAPANGADFSSKWDRPTAEVAVVDVPATSSSGIPTTAELTPSLPASSEV